MQYVRADVPLRGNSHRCLIAHDDFLMEDQHYYGWNRYLKDETVGFRVHMVPINGTKLQTNQRK